jgi:hypothetical protein
MATFNQIADIIGKYKKGDSDGVKRKGKHFAYKQTFFYKHGQTAESVAENIKNKLAAAGIRIKIIDKDEHWAAWPADSFWEITFAVENDKGVSETSLGDKMLYGSLVK